MWRGRNRRRDRRGSATRRRSHHGARADRRPRATYDGARNSGSAHSCSNGCTFDANWCAGDGSSHARAIDTDAGRRDASRDNGCTNTGGSSHARAADSGADGCGNSCTGDVDSCNARRAAAATYATTTTYGCGNTRADAGAYPRANT